MQGIVHTMPFMILKENELKMAENCLKSFAEANANEPLVLYNQGYLTNNELIDFINQFKLNFIILGEGRNIGIPAARQSCFEYIWNNIPSTKYISELHVDMIFTKGWSETIIEYLKKSKEPMLSPGILTVYGELHPHKKGEKSASVPNDTKELKSLLEMLATDRMCEGFVHPVIHKSDVLKEIGGYDLDFLKGQQGYEDDSILLGYRYYMGTGANWRPKAYLKAMVYHISLAQRMQMKNIQNETSKNLDGLIKQYGVYGLKQLSQIHGNDSFNNIVQLILENNLLN